MMQSLTKNTLPFLLSLLWPGTGHIALSSYSFGIFFGGLPLFLTFVFVISRFIVEPEGFVIYAGLLLINYLMAIAHCFYLVFYKEIVDSKYVRAIYLPLLALPLSAIIFWYKSQLLGIGFFQIPSKSMLPTLQVGDIIAVDTWRYYDEPSKHNDIVVFTLDDTPDPIATKKYYVKRITAIENDTVDKKGGLINHQKTQSMHNDIVTINNNEVYVMGDNRAISKDSRHYGVVSGHNIIGKGIFIIVRGTAYAPFNWSVYGTRL